MVDGTESAYTHRPTVGHLAINQELPVRFRLQTHSTFDSPSLRYLQRTVNAYMQRGSIPRPPANYGGTSRWLGASIGCLKYNTAFTTLSASFYGGPVAQCRAAGLYPVSAGLARDRGSSPLWTTRNEFEWVLGTHTRISTSIELVRRRS